MCSLLKKNKNKKRIVVVTAGPQKAYITEYDFINERFSFSELFEPVSIGEELIVDTNGAGDAFAGGFLSKYLKGLNLEESMKEGHLAASSIIQVKGCQLPSD